MVFEGNVKYDELLGSVDEAVAVLDSELNVGETFRSGRLKARLLGVWSFGEILAELI